MIRSKQYTDGARGQDCTLQIVGVCTNRNVVFCHFPDESHGTALKADDHVGGDGCMDCHDVVDRRRWSTDFEEHREFYLRRAQNRTIRNRIEQGLLTMKGHKV